MTGVRLRRKMLISSTSAPLLLRLALCEDALVARDVPNDLLALDVRLVPGLAFERLLPWRGGVRVGIGVEEVGLRVPSERIRLVAGLVRRRRGRAGLVVGTPRARHHDEALAGSDPVADFEELRRVSE